MSDIPKIDFDQLTLREQNRVTRLNTIGKAIEDSVKNKDLEPDDILSLTISLIRAYAGMEGISFVAALANVIGFSEHAFPVDMGDGS